MSDWTKAAARADDSIFRVMGRSTTYQRPGYDEMALTGIPKFLARLEDVNRGQFISMSYRLKDFSEATFSARVIVSFSGAPNSNGTLVFDGVEYTAKATLTNEIPNQFLRGSSAFEAAANLAAAINADGGAGTVFSGATEAHPTCSAALDTDNDTRVIVSYLVAGITGNGKEAQDHMSYASLDSRFFYGGGPLVNDLITFDGTLYRVSDDPAKEAEGAIHLRLEKKAV